VGSHVRTTISSTASGTSSANFQFTALGYDFPADRGLAPKAWITKYGCELPMSEINRWPTARTSQLSSWIEGWMPVPVAPRMPHFFFDPAAGDIVFSSLRSCFKSD